MPDWLDWLFAPQCIACREPARALCPPCEETLLDIAPACARCAEPLPAPAVACRRCTIAALPLDRIVARWRYGGQLAVAIQRLKFDRQTWVARSLAPLWSDALAGACGDGAVVVPMPHHWRRRWERGFDHVALLARHACRVAGLPRPVDALDRARATPPQSKLGAAARRANVTGAFRCRDPRLVAGKRVVLVDDVATTCATLAAAAIALRDAGAASVTGVVVARATYAPG